MVTHDALKAWNLVATAAWTTFIILSIVAVIARIVIILVLLHGLELIEKVFILQFDGIAGNSLILFGVWMV